MDVRVQQDAFDAGAELNRFSANRSKLGAIVTFTGLVRDVAGGLHHMEIEHYPAMTASAVEEIVAKAEARWNLGGSLVIHRFGRLAPGDQIMMVATASPHRADAFQAAEYLMDYLKSRAPFWKKEVTDDHAGWVKATQADDDARDRWKD